VFCATFSEFKRPEEADGVGPSCRMKPSEISHFARLHLGHGTLDEQRRDLQRRGRHTLAAKLRGELLKPPQSLRSEGEESSLSPRRIRASPPSDGRMKACANLGDELEGTEEPARTRVVVPLRAPPL